MPDESRDDNHRGLSRTSCKSALQKNPKSRQRKLADRSSPFYKTYT